MFAKIDLLFTDGRILKKEGLESLRDYPREYLDILYDKYEDGIIEGLIPVEKNGMIQISPGIVKYRGHIYKSKEYIELKIHEYNDKSVIIVKLRFNDLAVMISKKIRSTEIQITRDFEIREDEIEIFRYIDNLEVNWNQKQKNFFEMLDKTISPDFSFRKCSTKSGIGLDILLIEKFIDSLVKLRRKKEVDIWIISIFNSKNISNQILEEYIALRNESKVLKDRTNQEILESLKNILRGDK